jgi:hypothetical protein
MTRILAGAVAVLVMHVTPTVELVKRVDAVRQMFPAADAWFERELHLSDPDAHKLHEALDWSPEDGVLRFYTGKRAGSPVGALVFVRIDTPHGPLEVAVGFAPGGTIASVVVTKATVETKPWVQTALRAGLCGHDRGMGPGTVPKAADAIRDAAGELPTYMGTQVDKAVRRALVAYADFYR